MSYNVTSKIELPFHDRKGMKILVFFIEDY
jgi:hypothetical protein